MTTGQRAMAVAKIFPEPIAHRGKASEAAKLFNSEKLSESRVSQARTIIRWAPDMADGVLGGSVTLGAAYAVASDRKIAAEAP